MSRALRIEYPGAFYHVFSRGVDKRNLYEDELDYRQFLKLCLIVHERFELRIHAYCLMPNHYHLFVETPKGNLSKALQYLNACYTEKFNFFHDRSGTLFQGRYKAIVVDEESYGLLLSRYIHLNPVKGGLVIHPGDYPWSSMAAYLGKIDQLKFLKTDWLLGQFCSLAEKAREIYCDFVLSGISDDWEPKKNVVGGVILGNPAFVEFVKAKYIPHSEYRMGMSISRLREILGSEPGL